MTTTPSTVEQPKGNAWHSRSAEDILAQLGSTVSGLSSPEAARRLAENGPNELKEGKPISPVQMFFFQFIAKPTGTDRHRVRMRCSGDLRQRVVDVVRSGDSKVEAARRFKVGEASVCRWLNHGGLTHQRPGPKTAHALDGEALRRHVTTHADLTQAQAARHVGGSRHCIWTALHKMGGPGENRPATQSAARCNEERCCVFGSGTDVAACSSCLSMSAASRLPSHAARGMPTRDTACTA
ncbi:MAG: hypothetical protein JSR29_10450 [Nitrospira sp.]|nr:hypothetical protein [Nitrospira sp.]